MKIRSSIVACVCGIFLCSAVLAGMAFADKTTPETIVLQFEGAKLAPVPFSHKVHVDKEKIDCAKCHHKDKNPREPAKCTTCHLLKEVKDNAALAKDAFHKSCTTCHKEETAKGKKAPTKCNECHKK